MGIGRLFHHPLNSQKAQEKLTEGSQLGELLH